MPQLEQPSEGDKALQPPNTSPLHPLPTQSLTQNKQVTNKKQKQQRFFLLDSCVPHSPHSHLLPLKHTSFALLPPAPPS